MRILYVEDNEVNQALVGRVARARKCSVVFREEGESALEVLAEDASIDLVLLDIELAGSFNGLDVVRTMRARNDRRPVVAITAYAMMGDRERILEAGCDHYLPKPVVVTDLLGLIDRYEREAVARPAVLPAAHPTPAAPAAPAAVPVETLPAVPTPQAKQPDSASTPAPPALAPASAPAPVLPPTLPTDAAPVPVVETAPESKESAVDEIVAINAALASAKAKADHEHRE